MTIVHESWVDATLQPADGQVRFSAPAVREAVDGDRLISTTAATVNLVNGSFRIEVEPGLSRVRVALEGVPAYHRLIVVPNSGEVRLSDLTGPVEPYPEPVVSEAWAAARLAEESKDLAIDAAERSQVAVKVTSVNGQDGDVTIDADDVGARSAGPVPLSEVLGLISALAEKAERVHGHTIANVTGLQDVLDGLEPAGTARQLFEGLIGTAPETLDTLVELAAALGNDPNFATTITAMIGDKAPLVHAHAIADTTGLQAALNGKAASDHDHAIEDVTGLAVALTGADSAASRAALSETAASAAAVSAKDYRDAAQTHRNDAEGFKNEAQDARNEVVIPITTSFDWSGAANFASNPSLIAKPTIIKRKLVGDTVVNFVPGTPGLAYTVELEATQDAVGGRTLGFTNVSWAYGLTPPGSETAKASPANATDVYSIRWTGVRWIGTIIALGVPAVSA